MSIARAGRRQRLEPQTLQVACAADVPGIGNDKAAGLVKLAEGSALVGDGWTKTVHAHQVPENSRQLNDCCAGQTSAQRADISPPAAKPFRHRADRPWRAGFPATASGW